MRSLILAALLALPLATWPAEPQQQQIDVAFSPEAGAEALVLRVIDSAHQTIRMAAYTFTSPQVIHALLNAKKRGVDVQVLIDDKGNRSKKSTAAKNLLVNADIPVRTISAYAIHHSKFIVVDGATVETGSFNYSKAAAKNNSENVLVVWNNPEVAATYTRHWERRWELGTPVQSTY